MVRLQQKKGLLKSTLSNPKLWIILAVAVILRLAAALYLGDQVVQLPGTADQISYHTLAVRVLEGHGFSFPTRWWPHTAAGEPTAHWSYLYTLYLATVYRIFGIHPLAARLIQAFIVGLLQPYLAYVLAGQVYARAKNMGRVVSNRSVISPATDGRQRIQLGAAAITAVYIYFIYYAAALMTEPFYITAILATLTLAISLSQLAPGKAERRTAVALGLVISAAVLLRQLFLLFVPFLFVWLIAAGYRKRSWRQAIPSLAIISALLLSAILPATIYNYARFDRFVLLNTNAGFALFWANHPIHETNFQSALEMGNTYWELIPAELNHLDEAALDQALLKESIRFVTDDPLRYLQLTLSRIPEYIKFWPDPASSMISNVSRLASFTLFLPFMLYGLIRSIIYYQGMARRSRGGWVSPLTLLFLFIIVYTAIHLLSWTQIRYRLPVDAILIIFAAVGLLELAGILKPLLQLGRSKPEARPQDPLRSLDQWPTTDR